MSHKKILDHHNAREKAYRNNKLAINNEARNDPYKTLQRIIGNQSLAAFIQAKLGVSQADDPLEREADRIADEVMRNSAVEALQNQGKPHYSGSNYVAQLEPDRVKGTTIQRGRMPVLNSELSRSTKTELTNNEACLINERGALSKEINSARQGGQSLAKPEQDSFQNALRYNFNEVKIHTDQKASRLANRLNARAFTTGKDIFFGNGEFRPQTERGKRLLAHELVHVAQQSLLNLKTVDNSVISRVVKPEKVSCSDYPENDPVIKKIKTNEPDQVIGEAAKHAVKMLQVAIDGLKATKKEYCKYLSEGQSLSDVSNGSKTVASIVYAWLKSNISTRKSLEYLWKEKGAETVYVIIKRLEAAMKILDGGEMSYTCLGKDCFSRISEGDIRIINPGHEVLEEILIDIRECDNPLAYVTGPGYRIYLCELWWDAPKVIQAVTLIHEALHIYFWDLIGDAGPPMENAYEFEKLVRRLNIAKF